MEDGVEITGKSGHVFTSSKPEEFQVSLATDAFSLCMGGETRNWGKEDVFRWITALPDYVVEMRAVLNDVEKAAARTEIARLSRLLEDPPNHNAAD